MKIAWIGTGVMGQSMAGHDLTVFASIGGGACLGTQALIKELEKMNA
jgi:hypothetical protein